MTARLALLHWVWRLLRRERRQHALVVAMVAFGIAGASVAVSTVVRLQPPLERSLAGADAVVTIRVLDAAPDQIAALRTALGDLMKRNPDVESIEWFLETNEGIQLVAQDPLRPLGRAWLDLREGRWPGPGEVSLSTRAFARLAASVGHDITLGSTATIGGEVRTIVGRHDNPTNLDLVTALIPDEAALPLASADVLVPPGSDAVGEILALAPSSGNGAAGPPPFDIYSLDRSNSTSGGGGAVLGYLLGTLLCLQIAVLASAGFTVLANRRRRQFGMLAAIGAEPAQLGSVMVFTGLVVGLIGGLIGLGAGIAASIALTPALQHLVDYRLVASDLAWNYLLPMMPIAVATAVAAAWWPARRVRSASAIDAIANRAARQAGFARSLAIGTALIVGGAIAMKVAAPKNSAPLVIASVLAIVVGALMLTPASAVLLGAIARSAPLPIRLAWRDIARNQGRSAAAIAAAAIATALPFGVATFTASIAATWQSNVPANVAHVYSADQRHVVNPRPPDDVTAAAAAVPGSRIVQLMSLVDQRAAVSEGFAAIPFTVQTTRSNGDTIGLRTALATPELLAMMNVERPPNVDVIVWASGTLQQLDPSLIVDQREPTQRDGFPEALLFTAPPGTSIDQTVVDSWYIVADHPLTTLERDRLAAVQGANGWMNLSERTPPFVAVRSIAVGLGGLFALAAIAVAVALIRTENTGDDWVLACVGASRLTSRSVAASTTIGLTAVSAVIGIVAPFAMLIGVYLNPDENFTFAMPWGELAVLLVAVPLLGGAVTWLVTGPRRRPAMS